MKKLALPFVVTTVLAPTLLGCNKDRAETPSPPPADAKLDPQKERIHRNPPKPQHEPEDLPDSDEKSAPPSNTPATEKAGSGSAPKPHSHRTK